MAKEMLTVEAAANQAAALPFAWIRRPGGVTLGENPGVQPEPFDEARFFGPKEEIHFYTDGGELLAVRTFETKDEAFADKTAALLPGFGGRLTVRRILTPDEDGQMTCRALRLCDWKDWEGGEEA